MNQGINPWPDTCREFSEQRAFKEILKDDCFKNFYIINRSLIRTPIICLKDTKIPKGINARNTITTSQAFLRLKEVPCKLNEATIIAHELQHIILHEEGFPKVGFKEPMYENLTSALSSMLEDPIVNMRIKKYGFNLREMYDNEENESINILKRLEAPTHHVERSRWIFNYVGLVLEWMVAYEDSQIETCNVSQLFQEKFPEIAQSGNKLIETIVTNEHNTPEQIKTLYLQLISEFDLNNKAFLTG